MYTRPKIKLQLSAFDKALQATGYFMIIFLWGFTIYAYFNLPDRIPTHFNFSGRPDSYGSKISIIVLPIVSTVIFFLLTFLSKYPHVFNYAAVITEENAEQQYTYGTRMLRFLKLAVIINFTLINVFTYFTAIGKSNGLAAWFLPFMLGMIIIPVSFFIYKSLRAK